jgi:hypothetical protein
MATKRRRVPTREPLETGRSSSWPGPLVPPSTGPQKSVTTIAARDPLHVGVVGDGRRRRRRREQRWPLGADPEACSASKSWMCTDAPSSLLPFPPEQPERFPAATPTCATSFDARRFRFRSTSPKGPAERLRRTAPGIAPSRAALPWSVRLCSTSFGLWGSFKRTGIGTPSSFWRGWSPCRPSSASPGEPARRRRRRRPTPTTPTPTSRRAERLGQR